MLEGQGFIWKSFQILLPCVSHLCAHGTGSWCPRRSPGQTSTSYQLLIVRVLTHPLFSPSHLPARYQACPPQHFNDVSFCFSSPKLNYKPASYCHFKMLKLNNLGFLRESVLSPPHWLLGLSSFSSVSVSLLPWRILPKRCLCGGGAMVKISTDKLLSGVGDLVWGATFYFWIQTLEPW